MAIYTNLPIYKASYMLLLAVHRLIPNMPRDCRYSLATELRGKIVEIIVLIYRANRVRQKEHIIGEMRETMTIVQVYLRLLSDMRYISEKQYMLLAEQTASMSKQMAAWHKSSREKTNDE